MDVFCVGMFRAASTWQYHVAGHLLERYRGAERLGYVDGRERYAALPPPSPGRWRFLKAHGPHDLFAAHLASGSALALYSFRDLRDVYVSLAQKLGRSPAHAAVIKPLTAQCVESDRFWRSQPNVLCQRYEELIAAPETAVAQIAGHLGIAISAGESEEVAAEYSMASNRRRTEEISRSLRETGHDLDDPQNVNQSDPHTLLHWNHINAGRVGGWRDVLTPEERAWLGEACGDWLVANGYAPGPEVHPSEAGP